MCFVEKRLSGVKDGSAQVFCLPHDPSLCLETNELKWRDKMTVVIAMKACSMSVGGFAVS